jgi:APA family basic amino acid/polyamine antiporter
MASEGAVAGNETRSTGLVRALGSFDVALITVGSMVGSAIFLAAGDAARSVPHPVWLLALWVAGGLLTLAGALSYGELGAMFPRAGGLYHYLREAYGPLSAFLFGWTSFLVIMTGGIAALAVGFGEYLGVFVPFFSTGHRLLEVPIGRWTWVVSGGQLAGVLAIAFLTWINYRGLREGTGLQNAVTLLKMGSIAALVVIAFAASPGPVAPPAPAAPVHFGGMGALAAGFIAVLWSYDGWYGATFLAGEMKKPERNLPVGLMVGTLSVIGLYLLANGAYLRALTVEGMATTPRVGEAAARSLLGPFGAQALSAAVFLSIFGCLSATVLYAGRVYIPMAEDGLFFRGVARIHPKHRTPSGSLVAQGVWASLLTLSGTYEQLYTYVIVASFLFHAATGAAVIVLRRRRPELPRPYRVWGYPVVPVLFVLTSMIFVVSAFVEKPVESVLGFVAVALGLPVYAWWRRRAADERQRGE